MASKLGTPKKRGDVKEAFELPSEELASHAQVNPTVEGTRTARVLMVSRELARKEETSLQSTSISKIQGLLLPHSFEPQGSP